ncbi:hypothetical protein ColLi_12289 [Colletotrichum liriopes]|uniref:Uncharacterized protein n=1 Tax=Colletotrichum liriopes TaxID=708192 RepID=A0AA37H003_9PEZI|nr:hypothetical protein ColLi_12289 [Colletotrichum liriopes]
MATSEDRARDAGPPKAVCVGMLRTGTSSLAAALSELGFKRFSRVRFPSKAKPLGVFRESRHRNLVGSQRQAPSASAEAFYSTRLGRALWSVRCGGGSVMLPGVEVIDAYPNAKIILTERDFDKRFASFNSELLQPLFDPLDDLFLKGAGLKTVSGFLGGARALEELRRRAPEVFRQHSERVKAHMEAERLRLSHVGKDGWEPLCKFLGKDVPKGNEFPRVNDRDSHQKEK